MEDKEKQDKQTKIFTLAIGVAFIVWIIYSSVVHPLIEKVKNDNIIMRSTEAAVIDWDTIMNYSGYGGEYIAIRGEPLLAEDNRLDVVIVNGHPWAIDSSEDDYEFSLSDYYCENGDFIAYGKLIGIFNVSYYLDYDPSGTLNRLIKRPMPVIKSEHVRGQD